MTTLEKIRTAVATVVVGKDDALDEILVALLCGGHVLLEDVPGVGKTLMARSLAAVVGCSFRRIQFTPDVLPSDITGSNIFNQQTGAFEFQTGPVFTQILLADEINRATPRTQSALLEAMEEQQVTIDGMTRPLPEPFFVIATQNPIDLEGTFILPEAQLDRFLLRVALGYPTRAEATEILRRFNGANPLEQVTKVTDASELLELRSARARIGVAAVIDDYILDIIEATRNDERIELGASPRAALALRRAAQARAQLDERAFVLPDDVKALAAPVLAHRLILAPQARLNSITAEAVIASNLADLTVPAEVEPLTNTRSNPA